MKKLEISQMECLVAAGPGRNCMLLGALAAIAVGASIWGPALTITAGATVYGCFNS